MQVKYNLGANDHHIGFFDVSVNDGLYHIVRFERRDANASFGLDEHLPISYMPPGRGLGQYMITLINNVVDNTMSALLQTVLTTLKR